MSLVVDEKLKAWAAPRQAQFIDAVNEHGSQSAAALALGVSPGNISDAIRIVKGKAAAAGYSPEHDFNKIVPEGFRLKRHSQYYDAEGNPRGKWVIANADEDARAKLIEAAFVSAAATLPRLPPLARPSASLAPLANLYTITDYHLGMQAWEREGGAPWDLGIAERTLVTAFEHMITSAPAARKAIINIQGDFLHTDGPTPVTPTHGHILDASARYAEMVDAAIRVLRRIVDLALMCHDEVEVIFAEGNHDLAGSMWLRKMFGALYENEPRLKVNDSELPFYVVQWGKVMIGVHHGHQVKNDALPLLFAAQFPAVWGATTKRYAHCGHRHHAEEKERSGMTVVQHPTLSARDAYAARGGWIAERAATCITYHEEFGQVARTIVTPEMLAAA